MLTTSADDMSAERRSDEAYWSARLADRRTVDAATGYSGEPDRRPTEEVLAGEADAVAFGRPFISNPDLVRRFRDGLALAPDDMRTWYSQGPEGYVDYPVAA